MPTEPADDHQTPFLHNHQRQTQQHLSTWQNGLNRSRPEYSIKAKCRVLVILDCWLLLPDHRHIKTGRQRRIRPPGEINHTWLFQPTLIAPARTKAVSTDVHIELNSYTGCQDDADQSRTRASHAIQHDCPFIASCYPSQTLPHALSLRHFRGREPRLLMSCFREQATAPVSAWSGQGRMSRLTVTCLFGPFVIRRHGVLVNAFRKSIPGCTTSHSVRRTATIIRKFRI